jgi:hypothetical protein
LALALKRLCDAIVASLAAYGKAAKALLDGQYATERELAPTHLRAPGHIYVACCTDGVIVRYDVSCGEEQRTPKLTILTYDDLVERARANLERHFGPLSMKTQNLDIYYYREDPSGRPVR